MSGIENSLSLADIAGLDVSDVEELRSSQLPAGLYTFEVTGGELTEATVGEDQELRFRASIAMKVIEIDTIAEKGVEESDVLGKSYTETFFIDPADASKGFGYLKGFVADIGGDNSGNPGGVEGAEEGFLNRLVTHRFAAKIIKKKGRDGNYYSRMQLLKKSKG